MRIELVTRSLLAGALCVAALAATKHDVNAAVKPKLLDKSYFFGGEPDAHFQDSASIAGADLAGRSSTCLGMRRISRSTRANSPATTPSRL